MFASPSQIKLGDETMSVLEIWGAEYQENDCLLIKPEDRRTLETICGRERCLMQVCLARQATAATTHEPETAR